MKNLLIILLFPFFCNAQFITVSKRTAPAGVGERKIDLINSPATISGSLKLPLTRVSPSSNILSYTLSIPTTTSAGVYKNDGTDDILVRTLWSNTLQSAATYSVSSVWDGKDDAGSTMTAGNYKIKVVENNISTTWGVIGNTSLTSSGTSYQGYSNLYDMCFSGSTAYVAGGLNEASPTKFKFNISNPQAKTNILQSGQGTSQDTRFVATDGTLVYWAEISPFDPGKSWVHATNISNDLQHTFTNGVNIHPLAALTFTSAFSYDTDTNYITGLAVSSNYIFVARASLNQLKVYDKNALLVQTLTYSNVRGIRVDGSNILMITETNTVSKYPINSNGTLGTASLTLSGLISPLALNTSTDGTKIAVVDGSTSQQVKFFNNTTGVAGAVFGQAGGYETEATVYADKFMFRSFFGDPEHSYISFQSDGSFWLGDCGNMRNQHFTSSNGYIDHIAFIGVNYIVANDPNNPSRVFASLLEFNRDYTKTLAANNGSWTLTKNWMGGLSSTYVANNSVRNYYLRDVTTLSNGRTYGFLRQGDVGNLECVELTSGVLRLTGVVVDIYSRMDPNGDLYNNSSSGLITQNLDAVWTKRTLTGFTSNNPVWGTSTEILRMTGITATDPVFRGIIPTATEVTSTGVRISYKPTLETGYHIGGIKNGKWLWKIAPSTTTSYTGPFPTDGRFEIGNGVNVNAGGPTVVKDRIIDQTYHGEGWKEGQVNIHNLFLDNGLMLTQFGAALPYQFGAPKQAGNALSVTIVKVGDIYYIHHCDESYNGGVHEFAVSGVGTIAEYSFNTTIN